MARECSWVTPHLSYQSTHELHLYELTMFDRNPILGVRDVETEKGDLHSPIYTPSQRPISRI